MSLTLLAPTLQAIEERYNMFAMKLELLQDTVARKAEGSVVDELIARVSELSGAVDGKAEFCEVEQVNAHLQTVSNAVKAAQAAVDTHASQLLRLDGKAEQTKVDGLASKLDLLETGLKQKAEFVEVESVFNDVHTMKLLMPTKASIEHYEGVEAQLRSLSAEIAGLREMKADAACVDQLNSNYRAVNSQLAAKAEFAEVTHLKAQVQSALQHLPKAQAEELERLGTKIQSLSTTVALVSGSPDYHRMEKRLEELNDTVGRKADKSAMVESSNQLAAQYNALNSYIQERLQRSRSPQRSPAPASAASAAPVPRSPPRSAAPGSGALRPMRDGSARRSVQASSANSSTATVNASAAASAAASATANPWSGSIRPRSANGGGRNRLILWT